MSILYAAVLYKKDTGIADIGWGMGFILITLYTLIHTDLYTQRQLLVALLVLVWGIRLKNRAFSLSATTVAAFSISTMAGIPIFFTA